MSDKLKKERKKLEKGCVIYTLEIAFDPEKGTVEYIVEGFDEIGDSKIGPLDSNWDYLESYFDEETLDIFNYLYEVAET